MSEPDIAALARRLAEQNNVDWRALTGTGPDGKIVERDVLDYLARVMAGEEAVDPTPEPLPEGMEAWPDQDAPTYFKPGGANHQAAAESAAPQPVEDEPRHVASDPVTEEEPYLPADAPLGSPAAGAVDDVFAEPGGADLDGSADEELSDDIFLFEDDDVEDDGDDATGVGFAPESSTDAEPAPAWLSAAGPQESGSDDFADDFGDADDLLVADDDFDTDDFDTDDLGTVADQGFPEADAPDGAPDAAPEQPYYLDTGQGDDFGATATADERFGDDLSAGGEDAAEPPLRTELDDVLMTGESAADGEPGTDVESGDLVAHGEDEPSGAFDPSLGSYDQEFTTPSEQFDSGADATDWSTGQERDLSEREAPLEGADDEGALPDLWATDGTGVQADEVTPFETEETAEAGFGVAGQAVEAPDVLGEAQDAADELTVDFSRSYEAPVADEQDAAGQDAAGDLTADLGHVDEDRPVTGTEESFGEVAPTADDVEDLEQAAALDEHDAVTDLQELDGEPSGPAPLPYADLPLMRSGTVLRRHVDLSALAAAQLAAGLELGHEEPLAPAPFLVRAVAKAAAELGTVHGQVALAELGDEVTFRRVDDAAGRSFASLVQELEGDGPEEDELGVAAVDLSGFDMDEALLDLEVPAVTLGRTLYDTQRGSHRSTLSLSGGLPVNEGAKLLARVADLLESPVRLLL